IYFVLYSLLREYSLIRPYLNEVHVFDSGHMTLPMINMNQITTIREKVSQSMDTLDNIYSIVVKDNFEGVLYRWILHSIDPESLSMIIPHSKDLHVVSSINPNKVPSVSELESRIKKAPDSLRSMMLDYLNNECGMKSDPV